jgi:hypothetical protein
LARRREGLLEVEEGWNKKLLLSPDNGGGLVPPPFFLTSLRECA